MTVTRRTWKALAGLVVIQAVGIAHGPLLRLENRSYGTWTLKVSEAGPPARLTLGDLREERKDSHQYLAQRDAEISLPPGDFLELSWRECKDGSGAVSFLLQDSQASWRVTQGLKVSWQPQKDGKGLEQQALPFFQGTGDAPVAVLVPIPDQEDCAFLIRAMTYREAAQERRAESARKRKRLREEKGEQPGPPPKKSRTEAWTGLPSTSSPLTVWNQSDLEWQLFCPKLERALVVQRLGIFAADLGESGLEPGADRRLTIPAWETVELRPKDASPGFALGFTLAGTAGPASPFLWAAPLEETASDLELRALEDLPTDRLELRKQDWTVLIKPVPTVAPDWVARPGDGGKVEVKSDAGQS